MAYLDHAATTPMLPAAVAAMTAELTRVGNASSLHASGRRARRVVEESRETIADAVDARPSEVVFTSGGTEADNLAVKGFFWRAQKSGGMGSSDTGAARPRRILVSAVEHHAVLDAAQWLAETEGAIVEQLEVDELGRVHPRTLRAAIGPDVALVSVMWANNEVGSVQPIKALAAIAHDHGVPFHTDAVQAVAQLPVSFAESGVDALTLTGHKVGGPIGAGALILARDAEPVPVLHGGGQERDVRSGTLDAPAIAGFAAAVQESARTKDATGGPFGEGGALAALRDELIERVHAAVPDAQLNGDPKDRLPGNAHFTFPGCEGDALLMLLDARGVECSTGSACSAGVAQPSHVLLAMGVDAERARGSLRFSLGHTSTRADIDALIDVLPGAVERARKAGLTS